MSASPITALPPPLTFEHLVEVDGDSPGVPPLGLARVWRGLVLRMEFPQHFQPGLSDCRLLRHSDIHWSRSLDYGSRVMHDEVRIDPQQHRIDIDMQSLEPPLQASLSLQIETPAPGQVWVRFRYRVRSPEHHPESPLAGMVQQAWRQADEETIFRMRQLAASGVLDGHPH